MGGNLYIGLIDGDNLHIGLIDEDNLQIGLIDEDNLQIGLIDEDNLQIGLLDEDKLFTLKDFFPVEKFVVIQFLMSFLFLEMTSESYQISEC